ncbi:DNA primase [Ferrithrix thermotolerans DSM 19514]|uniref:DNA primase n=1 Tax=Ferrithrix thermotolerans DSM 19514 TaxID=1121881 RepID=A0A1M4US78_9ACTN|nr:DNA primase [Ferrithrix thermotolerans]SHE59566.1 DNA primase [Ferrithrix thermotolerans DSM 19514]
MAYSDDDKERVLTATDMVALVSEQVPLKRVGRRFVGLCPFHSEGTPSFSVNPEQGLYYCFGCQASGDAISFVMQTLRVDFQEALEHLARRSGIQLIEVSSPSKASKSKRESHLSLLSRAQQWFAKTLADNTVGREAREYLRSRGITQEAIDRFGIGFAPEEADLLQRAIGASAEDFVEVGLGYKDDRGLVRDHFRGRVMFPISDATGRVVAFGGRILPEIQEKSSYPLPKYKNSPETYLYHKRRVLYGLDLARSTIVARNEVVVCEGYTDVVGLWQAGVENAVATCGTALSDEHFERLKNFAKRIVLSFDADSAGQNAAERFYKFEKNFNIQIYVAKVPYGKDPAEVAKDNPELLPKMIEDASPYLMFRLSRLFEGADMTTSEQRAKVADEAISMLIEHPSPLVRSEYLGLIADATKISFSELKGRVERRAKVARRGVPSEDAQTKGRWAVSEGDRAALETLRHLINDPGELSEIVVPQLFRVSEFAELATIVGNCSSVSEAASRLSDVGGDLSDLFYRLIADPPVSEILDVLATFVSREALYELESITQRLKRGDVEGDLLTLSSRIAQARRLVEAIGSGVDVPAHTGELISWLLEVRSSK